ncbi:MAG: hypothetical protein Q4A66_10665 [Eubacteriales bacterium]|nr:hypothetical protein [Eubacteriales bacterium]
MEILEKYYAELDRRSREQRDLALQSLEKGEEREYTIHLMQAGMMGDMLKVLGRVQHLRERPGHVEGILASLEKEEEKQNAAEDYDLADRARIKAQTIRQAMALLERLENEHA